MSSLWAIIAITKVSTKSKRSQFNRVIAYETKASLSLSHYLTFLLSKTQSKATKRDLSLPESKPKNNN